MWIWLVASLIILGGCIIFALRVFFSNDNIMSIGGNYFSGRKGNIKYALIQQEKAIIDLKIKLQAVEDNSTLYINQLTKLQSKLDKLGKKEKLEDDDKSYEDDENWEDMYYKIRDEKEKLEEEYDLIKQNLEEAQYKLQEIENKEIELIQKQSDLETQLLEAYSLQNKIGELQRELEGAVEREKQLRQNLDSEKNVRNENKLLQKQYAHLKMEADELRNQLQEINNRDILLQQKVNRLNELESSFEISEQEKTELRKSVEEIITENATLFNKLQQLQGKLSSEKFP